MAATDVTYLFFRRDTGGAVDNGPLSPSIKTARVIQHPVATATTSVRTRWLGSRVVSVLDSGAEGPGFKSQSLRCQVTVLGKQFTPRVPLFTKQQNW